VSQPPNPRRPGPPHPPGVRNLVEGKRRWSSPPKIENLEQGFRGWHERGYLPHRDEPGLTQFVAFRFADSFPESLRSEWKHLWKIEDDLQRRAEWEAYLDRGRGEFWQADYWDTDMRNREHEWETRKYIENNPAKAGLVLDPKTWPWSSARFRDEYGVVNLCRNATVLKACRGSTANHDAGGSQEHTCDTGIAAAGLRHSRAPAPGSHGL
jgi:hypothetical protein